MKSFSTSILIDAPAARIWALLTDAPGYPSWNTTVERIDGTIALGETVRVHAHAAPGRAFPLVVTRFETGRFMAWSGGMPLGLFRGERTFTLTQGEAGVTFGMSEAFSGLLAPLITRTIPDLQPAFDQFARDLRRQAESLGPS